MRRILGGAATLGALLGAASLALAGFSSGTASTGNSFTAAADLTAPTTTTSVIAKAAGGVPGYIRPGGSYHVYANVGDTGNPASGVAAVTGDLTAATPGESPVGLVAGSFSVDGVTYNRRSAAVTAGAALLAGAYGYQVAASDGAGNAGSASFSVTVDASPPFGEDVQALNQGGGVAGRPDAGDTLALTYAEPLEPTSILPGWGGAATAVIVRIANNGANDQLSIRNAGNTAALPLGTVALSGNYVSATTDFGAAGTPSAMAVSADAIVVTLGRPTTTANRVLHGASMTWTPSATATDRAGNPAAISPTVESGALDPEF